MGRGSDRAAGLVAGGAHPSPVGHALGGIIAGWSAAPRHDIRAAVVLAAVALGTLALVTLGALVGNEFHYVANSPWDAYGAGGQLKDGAVLERGVVRRVDLGRPDRP